MGLKGADAIARLKHAELHTFRAITLQSCRCLKAWAGPRGWTALRVKLYSEDFRQRLGPSRLIIRGSIAVFHPLPLQIG